MREASLVLAAAPARQDRVDVHLADRARQAVARAAASPAAPSDSMTSMAGVFRSSWARNATPDAVAVSRASSQ